MSHIIRLQLIGRVTYYVGWIALVFGSLVHLVEQKNWTHVRKLLGWDRYDSQAAVDAINDLYRWKLSEITTCGASERGACEPLAAVPKA